MTIVQYLHQVPVQWARMQPLNKLWMMPNWERRLAYWTVELQFKGRAEEAEHCRKSSFTEFIKEKQEVQYLGQANPIDRHWLSGSYTGSAWRLWWTSNLNELCTLTANKGNHILRHLRRSMVSYYGNLWSTSLYSALVSPHLQNCDHFWELQFKKDVEK